MSKQILILVIGAPVACIDGFKDSWREVTEWLAEKLNLRFGDKVSVQYFDLFDPNCPTFPSDAQLPIVMVDGVLLSSGGKISMPLIRQRIEQLIEENVSESEIT